jgi:hypothetical protein
MLINKCFQFFTKIAIFKEHNLNRNQVKKNTVRNFNF